MKDTPYNRRKMRWYIKGMKRALVHLSGEDDPVTSMEDIQAEIAEIEKDWGLKPKQPPTEQPSKEES